MTGCNLVTEILLTAASAIDIAIPSPIFVFPAGYQGGRLLGRAGMRPARLTGMPRTVMRRANLVFQEQFDGQIHKLEGVAAPLQMINVDTDMIIPKQYLKTIKRTGLGTGLFSEKRYKDDGSENPDFVLNKPAYRKAKILVAATISAAAPRASTRPGR
jgi:hypothetical protein